jgi:hypothetical protein
MDRHAPEMHGLIHNLYSMQLPPVDEKRLVFLDNKLKTWFWKKKGEEPTKDEIEEYNESLLVRRMILGRAGNNRFCSDMTPGEGRRFINLYEDLYQDMRKYEYAWFGLILEDQSLTTHAWSATKVLLSLATELLASNNLRKANRVLQLVDRAIISMLLTTMGDVELEEHVSMMEYQHQLLSWKVNAQLNDKGLAVMWFESAAHTEQSFRMMSDLEDTNLDCFGFHDELESGLEIMSRVLKINRHKLQDDDDILLDIGVEDYWKCILAEGYGGDAAPSDAKGKESCVSCWKEESIKREFKRCGKCKSVVYCSRECQRADWQYHKPECRDGYLGVAESKNP